MAIVQVTAPAGTSKVNYGAIAFQPGGEPLDVPAYVAKTLITLPGFASSADLSPSYDALIGATQAAFEVNYLFSAYGRNPPSANQIAAAQGLMDSNGPPVVSVGA